MKLLMKTKLIPYPVLLPLVLVLMLANWMGLAQKSETPAKKKLAVAIKPQDVADALRAVIASDREVYTDRAAQLADPKSCPNPCELFRMNSEKAAAKGVEFSYVLRSLQPLRQRNAPETAIEKKGLEAVARQPERPFYSEEMLGGRWYFTAVYPDVAIHPSCASCHNQHPDSPRKDNKPGQVMGGVVVRIALEL